MRQGGRSGSVIAVFLKEGARPLRTMEKGREWTEGRNSGVRELKRSKRKCLRKLGPHRTIRTPIWGELLGEVGRGGGSDFAEENREKRREL